MLSFRRIGILAIIIVGLALAGWFWYPTSKELASYIRDVIFVLSALVAFAVFYDWQRSNVNTRWWIWDITFWNKKGVELSNFKLPAVIIHLVIVNPDVFTIVVDKIALIIYDGGNKDDKYRLTASAFSEEHSSEPPERTPDGVLLLKSKSSFYPIIIKPRSEEICRIVFMSRIDEAKKLDDMLSEGEYESKLELKTVTDIPISVKFGFNIDSSQREEYEGGTCYIAYGSIKEPSQH